MGGVLMDDGALRAALQRLLAHGEAAGDAKMMSLAKGNHPVAPESCPDCGTEMVDNKCPSCGYEKPLDGADDEAGLADLLESGAKE